MREKGVANKCNLETTELVKQVIQKYNCYHPIEIGILVANELFTEFQVAKATNTLNTKQGLELAKATISANKSILPYTARQLHNFIVTEEDITDDSINDIKKRLEQRAKDRLKNKIQ